ncbi:MAG: helix-turn-helix domain-containing protein [Gemmatimonadota bacterium]|nr:helix-turn-helix domain-containing protein [Gemmatimonadota bacterium]
MSRSTEEQDSARSRGRPEGLPKRWSAQRKAEVVLRLLRGEDIGEVSREVRVAPPELERWRRDFLDGGQQGLKQKNRAGGELMRTRAKLGEMTMRVELQAELLEKRGYGDELRKLLKRFDG